MTTFRKIYKLLLLFFYLVITVTLGLITVKLILNYNWFFWNLLLIILFCILTLDYIVDSLFMWFRKNFWFCSSCQKFRWLISEYEVIDNKVKTNKICEKCHNKITTLNYYD